MCTNVIVYILYHTNHNTSLNNVLKEWNIHQTKNEDKKITHKTNRHTGYDFTCTCILRNTYYIFLSKGLPDNE